MFLKENPLLDKKMIGEYISNRNNVDVLNSFIKYVSFFTVNINLILFIINLIFCSSFDLSGSRIDEALRMYLEAFRLPGESPLISFVLEPFTEYWHVCCDLYFVLAYTLKLCICLF